MTSKIMGFQPPQTKSRRVHIVHNSVPYVLKLKINLGCTKHSTATLATADKIYKLGKECLSWSGTDHVASAKVPKFVKQAIASKLLEIVLTSAPNDSFKVSITITQPPISQLSPSTDGILLIQSAEDFKKLFSENNSKARNGVLEKMVNLFTEISSFTDLDLKEILDVLELLSTADQQRIAKKIIENCDIQEIAGIVRSLQSFGQANYTFFVKLLLDGMVAIFVNKPNIYREDLNHLMQLLENLSPDNQACFIDKLFMSNQLNSNNLISENATTAFKHLQIQSYRLASYRHLNQTNTSLLPSLISTLTPSDFLRLIDYQFDSLKKDTLPNDVSTVTSHLICINTLMEIAISSKVRCLPKEEKFDPFYKALRVYRDKSCLTRWTINKKCRHPGYEVNFLAKLAIQMLKMIGSNESTAFTAVRHAFYFIKGVGELAAAVDIKRPWGLLKGIIDSGEWFHKAFSFKEGKLKSFMRLTLLQNAYLGGDPASLQEFQVFATELIDPKKEEANKKAFPAHHQSFFVMGLIELLHLMKQTYDDDSKLCDKATQLLEFIRNNNSEISNSNKPLFRVRPTEEKSAAREYIVDKITTFSTLVSQPKVENSIPSSNTSRVFLPAFQEHFPWVDSMRLNLEKLRNDKQVKADGPYVVELLGIDPKRESAPVTTLLEKALGDGKRLILITGEPGSGKSLFLKIYLLGILEKYDTSKPLPFFISLNLIREPNGKLIQEVLEKYGLKEYESALKQLPTVWFFDSYDEIFLGNDQKPFNIYETNGFEDWPNATFVFTCRKRLLNVGDEQQLFAPQGESVHLITISLFNDDQKMIFLNRYANKNPNATLKTGTDYFNEINNPELKDFSKIPFYLRKLAEYLPSVLDDLKMHKVNTIDNKDFFLDLMISQIIKDLIKREAEKTNSNPKGIRKPSEYLELILKVSHLMQISGKRSVSRFSASDKKVKRREGRKYSLGVEKETYIKNKIEFKHQLKIAKNNPVDENKVNELKNKIHSINKGIKKCEHQIQKVEDKLNIEKDLSKYLFDSEYEYLRSSALFTLNAADEMEFSHTVLHDYLILIHEDASRQSRLLKLFKPTEN